MNTFGSRLKNARQAKNMTQKELAAKIGAKHNSISNWENNQNKPDPDTIELICGALNIEPNYLLMSDVQLSKRNDRLIAYATQLYGKELLASFDRLDDINKKKVVTYSARLLSLQKQENEVHLNAAHEKEGSTQEERDHDNNIMMDDSEWE